jgi:hypothetical protein
MFLERFLQGPPPLLFFWSLTSGGPLVKQRQGRRFHHAQQFSRRRWVCPALRSSNNVWSLKRTAFPEGNVDDHFRALEHILEQINHKYVELAPHWQTTLRKNLKELSYCPSGKNSITISLKIHPVWKSKVFSWRKLSFNMRRQKWYYDCYSAQLAFWDRNPQYATGRVQSLSQTCSGKKRNGWHTSAWTDSR